MITDTKDKIQEYIQSHGSTRVIDLQRALNISTVAIHKQLKKLVEQGVISRVGKPPLVFYTLPAELGNIQTEQFQQIDATTQQIITSNFLSITPDGKLLFGMPGFVYWKQLYQKHTSLQDVAQKYRAILQEQNKLFSKEGWIDATTKISGTFPETPIRRLLFQDMYSLPTFGRTKLAKLVMYAKQTGERKLIDEISRMAKPIIEKVVEKYAIEAVAYIPPTVPRPVQFMDKLESSLQLSLPKIELVKVVPGDIPVPQKILSTTQERVINARDSIFLKTTVTLPYKNILLIDDVTGSGASFNETAKKILYNSKGMKHIIAFALVGNLKGFDVVRQI